MPYVINIAVIVVCMPWLSAIMMSPMIIASQGFSEDKSSIMTVMLASFYPVAIFLLLKLSGYHFFGTDPAWWAISVAIIAVLLNLMYGLPSKWNNLRMGISNDGYVVTDKHVYFNGYKIKKADPSTFHYYDELSGYSKDASHVFYNTKVVEGVHAPSFGSLEENYWKDDRLAYGRWGVIKGAEGKSFKYLGTGYAKDANHVYFGHDVVSGADTQTFVALEGFIGKDAQNVYVMSYAANNIKDVNAFELVKWNDDLFGKDNDHIYAVYYNRHNPLVPFPDVDMKTFEVLDDYYAKDAHRVYHYSYHRGDVKVIQEADPHTFVVEYDGYKNTNARDAKHHFISGELYQENK